jgi:two-component system, OmpR family, phosphate regulon sensor histidine kinase PhoR
VSHATKLWIAPLAWSVLALAFGVSASWTTGLVVAVVGFAMVATSRTFTLSKLDSVIDAGQSSSPTNEALKPVRDRFTVLHDQNQHQAAEIEAIRSAWDVLPASIVGLDDTYRIAWANASAKTTLGVDRACDVGEPINLRLREPNLIAALQAGFPTPIQMYSPEKNHRLIEISGVGRGSGGWLLIAVDITEARRVERMRRDFVGNVAHELKTPLTVIAGFNETLRSVSDLTHEELMETTRLIEQQTKTMQRLVSDLLSLSRLENNETVAPFSAFSVLPCVQRATQSAALAWPDGAAIGFDIPERAALCGDENEVEGALLNLLTNALRHTPADGRVEIVYNADEENKEIKLTVRDTGIGIPPEHLPRLSERFYRIDQGRARQTGGTGLGLAIVKHVMIRHEGRLDIQSAPGRGSAFSLVFPATRARNV